MYVPFKSIVAKYLKQQFDLVKYNRFFSKLISNKVIFFNQKSEKLCKINYNPIRSLSTKMPKYNYPKVRRDETVTENFHGQNVIFYSFKFKLYYDIYDFVLI